MTSKPRNDGPEVIKLMADYHCWPLWEVEPDVGNIDPGELPISASTRVALEDWAAAYDETLDHDYPPDSGFADQEREAAFETEGRRLWRALRRELGERVRVLYDSDMERRLLEPEAHSASGGESESPPAPAEPPHVRGAFVCPVCRRGTFGISKTIELRPDARWSEITLQLLWCNTCHFEAIGVYKENNWGASEIVEHHGYQAPVLLRQRLGELIDGCPRRPDRSCDCASCSTLSATDGSGTWNWLEQAGVGDRFALAHAPAEPASRPSARLVEMSAQGPGESSIDLLGDTLANHRSVGDFYACAMRRLMEGYDSRDVIETRIKETTVTRVDPVELKQEVQACLRSTPVRDFPFDMDEVVTAHIARNEWNDRQLVWTTPTMYCFLWWGTSV